MGIFSKAAHIEEEAMVRWTRLYQPCDAAWESHSCREYRAIPGSPVAGSSSSAPIKRMHSLVHHGAHQIHRGGDCFMGRWNLQRCSCFGAACSFCLSCGFCVFVPVLSCSQHPHYLAYTSRFISYTLCLVVDVRSASSTDDSTTWV